jgi:2-keto-3-deoxy-L-rhamnonate aldolase RhmA
VKDITNPARDKLAKGELSLGVGIRQARTGDVAKAMKTGTMDWMFIDLEHGAMSLDSATQIAVGGLDAGITPIVRVPKGEYSMATRALDGGALGIVMPHVDDADEAREIVSHLKYPPIGHRSAYGALPQFDFNVTDPAKAIEILNRITLTVVMLESPEAIERADEIAAVEGVDVLLIGTNDLTTEMGIPGQMEDDRVVAAYEKVLAACAKHGKWPGMGGVYAPSAMARYIGMGMKMILSGNDINFMIAGARERAQTLRDLVQG